MSRQEGAGSNESFERIRRWIGRLRQKLNDRRLMTVEDRVGSMISSQLFDPAEYKRIAKRVEALCSHDRRENNRSWEESHEILQIRRKAERARTVLSQARRLVETAPLLAQRGSTPREEPRFAVPPTSTEGRLKESLGPELTLQHVDRLDDKWLKVLQRLKSADRGIFALDVLHYFSRRSGVEAASLVFAILIALGAIGSYFYYAALGTSVVGYWTLEDLLMHGLMLVIPALLAFVLLGVFLKLVHFDLRRKSPGLLGELVLRLGPSSYAVALAVVTATLTTMLAFWYGERQIDYVLDAGILESAVVSDGTLLDEVYLAGTTSRTAILLERPGENERDQEQKAAHFNGSGVWDFLQKYSRIWFSLGRAVFGDRSLFPPLAGGLRVIALDRAHILCHGTAGWCDDHMRSVIDPPDEQLMVLLSPLNVERPLQDASSFAKHSLGCQAVERIPLLPEKIYFSRGDYSKQCANPVEDGDAQQCDVPVSIPAADMVEAASSFQLWVIGLASRVGPPAANLRVGERRASSVAEELMEKRWPDVRALSLGEALFAQRPVMAGSGEDDAAEDRRVEIIACRRSIDGGAGVAGPEGRLAAGM